MSEIEIYSSDSQIRLMEIKNLLENEGIDYQEVNKLDSSYAGAFGEIQLFVAATDAEKAAQLINSVKE